jgi:hypothetical protein
LLIFVFAIPISLPIAILFGPCCIVIMAVLVFVMFSPEQDIKVTPSSKGEGRDSIQGRDSRTEIARFPRRTIATKDFPGGGNGPFVAALILRRRNRTYGSLDCGHAV